MEEAMKFPKITIGTAPQTKNVIDIMIPRKNVAGINAVEDKFLSNLSTKRFMLQSLVPVP